MQKVKYTILAGLVSVLAANGGQIQIGGTNGLTSSYISSNGGSTTGWAERNYSNNLFEAATATPTVGQTNSLPPQTGPGSASTMVDTNGILFSMINDGPATGAANNLWASQTAGQQSITIPVNISGVTAIDLLLNDYYGYAGQSATITFNFASGADAIALNTLANGTGAIRSAVDCLTTTGTGSSVACPTGTTANGHSVSASDPTTVNTNTSGDATITTRSIWSATYNLAAGVGTNPYDSTTMGSTGKLTLDELRFTFSNSYAGTTLTSITLKTDAVNSAANSRLALSAVTVEGESLVTVTPEPSSVALLISGIALLGFGKFRKQKSL